VDNAQARKTTLIVAGILLLVTGWSLYRGHTKTVVIVGSIGTALLIIAMLIPALARRFHVMWMGLAGVLGYVNSRILLSLMFFAVVTPYGVLSRLMGRNPLQRRGPTSTSYWIPRKQSRQPKEQFERLF
jgi:hypothetical protein